MSFRFALLMCLLALHAPAYTAVTKIAIIKADDVTDKYDMSPYQRFIDLSKAKGVKVSMGIECKAFGTYRTNFRNFLVTNPNLVDVEYWHHGWDHDPADYAGTGYDYQKAHFTDSENAMHTNIGDWPLAFGPPGNAYDTDTVRVMNESDHMRLMFVRSTHPQIDPSKVLVPIVTGEPNPLGTGYNVYSSTVNADIDGRSGTIAVQFHPGSFVLHDGLDDLIEYGLILDHLLATGWTVMLPSEYVASLHIPEISLPTLVGGTVGVAYSKQLSATNTPTSWSISSGNLPAGLALTNSGRIQGTPTTAGSSAFTVRAINSGGTSPGLQLSIVIAAAPVAVPVITSPITATATVGMSFNYQIVASHGPTAYGATGLPAGLDVDSLGRISGIPTGAGTFMVSLSAVNGGGVGSATLSITIDSPTPAPPAPAAAVSSGGGGGGGGCGAGGAVGLLGLALLGLGMRVRREPWGIGGQDGHPTRDS